MWRLIPEAGERREGPHPALELLAGAPGMQGMWHFAQAPGSVLALHMPPGGAKAWEHFFCADCLLENIPSLLPGRRASRPGVCSLHWLG